MSKYILKRLLMIIPVLLGVTFIIFTVMNFTPGDPAVMILGEGATQAEYDALRAQMGLNDPFLVRYFRYVWSALQGDFGTSYRTGIPVFQEIAVRMPYTVNLAVISTIIAVTFGLPIGVFSAVKQYSLSDNVALGTALLLTSMPAFWFAMMLILYFSLKLHWLPSLGVTSWKHYILPAVATSANTLASLMRMTRSTMLEVIRQDYIRTARAKGQKESVIIWSHALKNALIPIVTIIGLQFGNLLGGALITESIFSIPGIGRLMVDAIKMRDYPIVQGGVLFIAVAFCIVNLLVDILYSYIDPRIKSQYRSS